MRILPSKKIDGKWERPLSYECVYISKVFIYQDMMENCLHFYIQNFLSTFMSLYYNKIHFK